jgi:hypothetical protein
MLTFAKLKTKPKEFLSATSLTVAEFERLLPAFGAAYETCYQSDKTVAGTERQRQAGAGSKGKLEQMEDKLLFILVYQKTYPLQTMQGLQFDLSQPQANDWIHRLKPILQTALARLEMKPEREAESLVTSEKVLEQVTDWLLDGSERRRQRPKDKKKQREHYSGKKKAHTDKNLLISNGQTKQVIYLSPTVAGKTHDKKAADQVGLSYLRGTTLSKDTGFQGYEPAGVVTSQPKKKPRGRECDDEDVVLNRMIASYRIGIEHTIAGVKRCRIVKETFRNLKDGFSDKVMEIACGLHNLRMDCRHPVSAINLLDLCT